MTLRPAASRGNCISESASISSQESIHTGKITPHSDQDQRRTLVASFSLVSLLNIFSPFPVPTSYSFVSPLLSSSFAPFRIPPSHPWMSLASVHKCPLSLSLSLRVFSHILDSQNLSLSISLFLSLVFIPTCPFPRRDQRYSAAHRR